MGSPMDQGVATHDGNLRMIITKRKLRKPFVDIVVDAVNGTRLSEETAPGYSKSSCRHPKAKA
ncbi:hypothetical protein C1H46_002267 [Malus baccata]|uniref:Uncharacterized protein n=1 Tax=Malus baccata TaxID=106549 RepID=A0A540NM18_MALBA|nr:hypothetical protein C1H46_002267 [Malus baccata]